MMTAEKQAIIVKNSKIMPHLRTVRNNLKCQYRLLVVVFVDAVIDPATVMIKIFNASIAAFAMPDIDTNC